MVDNIFSSFTIFASILADTFSSSFMRLGRLRDDAFDFNWFPQQVYKRDLIYILIRTKQYIDTGKHSRRYLADLTVFRKEIPFLAS